MRWMLFPPILKLLGMSADHELAAQVQYLKAENRILRSRLPKRLALTTAEKSLLVELGAAIRQQLKELVTVCSPRTFLRWLRAAENRNATVSAAPTRILGRPRTPDDLRELVLRIAKETGWGYTRIMGELRRLGIAVSRSTVKNILRQAGLEPGPQRGPGSWSEFLKIHAETLWQCDFFSTKAWTPRGLVECFALVFIHVGSRRVWVSPITAHPDGPWVERQARRFAEAEPAPEKAVVFHDRDTKFTTEFRAALKVGGFTPSKLPIRSPNLNCYVERWVQSIKQEALEPFIILGARHLNHLVAEYVEYFNDHRAHSSLHFRTPTTRGKSFPERPSDDTEPILRNQRLGGVLNWYERPSERARQFGWCGRIAGSMLGTGASNGAHGLRSSAWTPRPRKLATATSPTPNGRCWSR